MLKEKHKTLLSWVLRNSLVRWPQQTCSLHCKPSMNSEAKQITWNKRNERLMDALEKQLQRKKFKKEITTPHSMAKLTDLFRASTLKNNSLALCSLWFVSLFHWWKIGKGNNILVVDFHDTHLTNMQLRENPWWLIISVKVLFSKTNISLQVAYKPWKLKGKAASSVPSRVSNHTEIREK